MANGILDCKCGKKDKVQSCKKKDNTTCQIEATCECGSNKLILIPNTKPCDEKCSLFKLHRISQIRRKELK